MIENIIGNKVMVRILRFLYLSPNRYFSFLEIERFVGAGRAGIVSALHKLEYYGLVYTEKKGGKRYKLKLDNPIIETSAAIPNKNEMIELLKLFKNRQDVWILVEPKDDHIKNFRLAQKLLDQAN